MKVENTFDEVVFNAAYGYEPTQADLDVVVVPPGIEAETFFADLESTLAAILRAKGDGAQKYARDLAADASGKYLAAFDAVPKPRLLTDLYRSASTTEDTDLSAVADNIERR